MTPSSPRSQRATLVLATFVAALALMDASHARADREDPVDGFRMGGGMRIGAPINADPGRGRGAVNPQLLGFDMFLGYSFRGGVYFGAALRPFLGQKLGGDTFMAQQFVLDIGYVFQVDEKLGLRPTIELGIQRYGLETMGAKETDLGLLGAGGLDLIADVLPHLFFGACVRMGFALMDNDANDISVSGDPFDIYLQFGFYGGLRF